MDPEVLKKAPLFARLDDEAATALAATMGTINWLGARFSSTKAMPKTVCMWW